MGLGQSQMIMADLAQSQIVTIPTVTKGGFVTSSYKAEVASPEPSTAQFK